MPRKETIIGGQTDRAPIDLGEIGDPGPVEKVSETEFVEAAKLEEFMNEKVLVYILPGTDEGDLEIITPTVNGVNQPIIRGKQQWVRRKVVEALARGRITRYAQRVPDGARPDNIQMVPMEGFSYPFQVMQDKNQSGAAWLEAIKNQPS